MSKDWGRYEDGSERSSSAYAPRGWKEAKVTDDARKFTGGGGVWSLRVNAWLNSEQSQDAAAKAKIASLKGTPGLHIDSVTTGEVKSTINPDLTYRYTTLIYTYRDARIAENEIITAGRPADQAGLAAVMTTATKTFSRAG